MTRWLAIGALLAICAQPAFAADDEAPQQLPPPASFDGSWLGTIQFDKFVSEGATPKDGADFRIDIRDDVVRVWIKQDGGKFDEVMPGAFHFAPVLTNAVAYGTQFRDIWVETWSFTITQKDDDTLIANYVRIVNNRGMPLDSPDSKFSVRGIGEFKRIPRS